MGNPKLKISLVLGSDVEDTFTANYLILSAKHILPPTHTSHIIPNKLKLCTLLS
jgi:hypothetical protein